MSIGTFWSGHATQWETTVTYKIPPRVNLTWTTNQTFAHLPQGNFVARVFTLQGNYSASPFLSFSNLIQFDNLSHNMGWQSRVRWTLRPGNDLFISLNQGWIQETDGGFNFRAVDTKLSSKFQYTFRF